jgi:uncharacterized membrane protein
MTGWDVVISLHLLAMAFFVGGQLFLAAVALPVLRGAGDDRVAIRTVARRFGWGTLVALGVLAITGAAMASHFSLWSDSTLQVKLTLVVLVGALVVWHMRAPRNHALEGLILLGSLAIVLLGVQLGH